MLRPVVAPVWPLVPVAPLTATAVAHHGPAILVRGGPVQRAANLVARGATIESAAWEAARQGKGHVGELLQSADYTARAGVLGRDFHARPNPRANDPRVDVELRRGSRRRAAGAQVKVGSPQYALRAARSGKYQMLVVNTEARAVIARESGIELSDRLSFRDNEASALSAVDCEERAATTIARVLRDELPVGWTDKAVACAKAGGRAALESLAVGVLGDVVYALWSGAPIDLRTAVRGALGSAARSAARATLHSYLLVQRFIASARRQFSDRLLHRIAGSTVVLGAIAEVVVETSIDLVRVLRGQMTFDDLLRNFGVHIFTAAGGALGLALAGVLTGGAAWWVQAAAMLVGGAAGAFAGRRAGIAVFSPPTLARESAVWSAPPTAPGI